jgi:hypothetical protein
VTKLPSIDQLTPEAMRALVAELEAEAARRREERIAKGEIAHGPLVVAGHERSAQRLMDQITADMRAAGEKREIIFDDVIITGVPRVCRDYGIEPWPTGPL